MKNVVKWLDLVLFLSDLQGFLCQYAAFHNFFKEKRDSYFVQSLIVVCRLICQNKLSFSNRIRSEKLLGNQRR